MSGAKVPVLEINPANPNEVEMSLVPLEDIDDFLEDSVEDYELGFGELGAIKGKAAIKVKGSVKVNTPTVKPKAVLAAARVQKATAKAVATQKTQPKKPSTVKAGIKVSRVTAPVVRALKTAVKLQAKAAPLLKLNLPATGGKLFKPNIKAPAVKAKIVAKAAGKVAAKLNQKIAVKAKASSPKKIIKTAMVKPSVKLTVTKGKFPGVPVNKAAVAKKQRAKQTAAQVAALAPKLSKKTAKKLTQAVKGTPARGKQPKPVALCIKVFRAAGVRPCVIAQKKAALAASGGSHAPQLKARYQAKASQAMAPVRFRAVVTGLLGKLESQCAGDTTALARIKRIRKVSGVGNAN